MKPTRQSGKRRSRLFTLSDDVSEWLTDYALKTGVPMSHVIEVALRRIMTGEAVPLGSVRAAAGLGRMTRDGVVPSVTRDQLRLLRLARAVSDVTGSLEVHDCRIGEMVGIVPVAAMRAFRQLSEVGFVSYFRPGKVPKFGADFGSIWRLAEFERSYVDEFGKPVEIEDDVLFDDLGNARSPAAVIADVDRKIRIKPRREVLALMDVPGQFKPVAA